MSPRMSLPRHRELGWSLTDVCAHLVLFLSCNKEVSRECLMPMSVSCIDARKVRRSLVWQL